MRAITNIEQKISTLIHAIDADVVLIRELADQTVQALAVNKALLIALNKIALRITEMIEDLPSAPPEAPLLLDDDKQKNMESVEAKLRQLIRDNQQKRENSASDPKLRGTNKASVLSGYDQFIGCTQLLAHSVQELRWAAMEYDADASPVSEKSYTDIDEMFADLAV